MLAAGAIILRCLLARLRRAEHGMAKRETPFFTDLRLWHLEGGRCSVLPILSSGKGHLRGYGDFVQSRVSVTQAIFPFAEDRAGRVASATRSRLPVSAGKPRSEGGLRLR